MQGYGAEIATYIQLAHNLYAIPLVKVSTGSPTHGKEEAATYGIPFGVATGISLYYLF